MTKKFEATFLDHAADRDLSGAFEDVFICVVLRPVNITDLLEASLTKCICSVDISLIGDPHLQTVQQYWKNICAIQLDFCLFF